MTITDAMVECAVALRNGGQRASAGIDFAGKTGSAQTVSNAAKS